ncbi:FAD-dependent oxidoreductase [Nocardiopsis changdeensis]|uniref:FAD-dependent oxidoreductase n=1 Tax=Nocardiopsis changdeensis TaxID=2831969 RepID=A0ABX8BHF1_9ACTN|nr:FAD-dependent oxidoreductase [Nocardiopsis changdeensis]
MSTHVVVLGAGYTGLVAAKLAGRLPGVRVTLVNERDRFVERVRLHQWASGQALPPRPLSALLAGTGVDLVVDRVESLDPERRTVSLRGGGPLGYDLLVNALGSRSGRPPGVGPGPLPDHLHSVNEADHGDRLRARLAGARSVAVVGGGLTGLEAVTELAETRPELEVHLVTGRAAGADLSARGARYLRSVLADLGVRVHEGSPAAEVPPEGPVRADGRLVPADTTVWTAGFRVPEPAGAAGLEVTGAGRMVVDEGLRSVSHPEVYGVGDAAAARRPPVRRPGAAHGLRHGHPGGAARRAVDGRAPGGAAGAADAVPLLQPVPQPGAAAGAHPVRARGRLAGRTDPDRACGRRLQGGDGPGGVPGPAAPLDPGLGLRRCGPGRGRGASAAGPAGSARRGRRGAGVSPARRGRGRARGGARARC